MVDDFYEAVLKLYFKKKDLGQLSSRLEYPAQMALKKECLLIYRTRYLPIDKETILSFFDPEDKYKDIEKSISEFDVDKFRPLISLLKKGKNVRNKDNIRLLAWLIDFKPRPYNIYNPLHQEYQSKRLIGDFGGNILEEEDSEPTNLISETNEYPPSLVLLDINERSTLKNEGKKNSFNQKKLSAISAIASHEADFIENASWSLKRDVVHLSDVYTEREVEHAIEEEIKKSKGDYKFIFLIGDAGNGKTSVLWHLYQKSKELDSYLALFLKSTQLREHDFENILSELTLPPLIFLDTVDLLLHDHEDTERLIAFYNLIALAGGICISCCRPQEISSLNPLKELFGQNWKPFRIDNYTDGELEKAIRKYAEIYYEQAPNTDVEKKIAEILFDAKNDRSLKPIYANPLTNRMLFTLYAPAPLVEAINVFKLYEEFWQGRVVKDTRVGIIGKPRQINASKNLSKVAAFVALIMVRTGNITLNKKILDQFANWFTIDGEDIKILADRGILKVNDELKEIEFFHQTFFEHAAAKAFIDFIKTNSIPLLFRKIFNQEDHSTTESFFLSPILEHLLLLAEDGPINNLAEQCCLDLVSSNVTDQIRIGLYVYVLNTTHKPILHQAVHDQLKAFKKDQSVYIKRFLQIAVNINNERIPSLFHLLDIVWKPENWNIRSNLVELLEYLVIKAPKETSIFLNDHHVIDKFAENFNQRGEKREHQPSFKNLINILNSLAKSDLDFVKRELFTIATVNDLSINRFLLATAAKNELLKNDIVFFSNLYDLWISNHSDKILRHEFIDLVSDALSICWLNELPDISNLMTQLRHEKIEIKKHVGLLALAKVSYTFSDNLAENVFMYFKTKIEKEELFDWSKNLILHAKSTAEHKNLLEQRFLTDIVAYLKLELNGIKFVGRYEVILKSYKDYFSKIKLDASPFLYGFFKTFYLDKDYLAKTPELARLMLFSYLNGNPVKEGLIENLDIEFYTNNIPVSQELTTIINNDLIFTDTIFNFFVDLCILRREIRLLASQLDRICPNIFINSDEVPTYLFDNSSRLYEAALQSISTQEPNDCADGAHLLAMLVKIGLIARPSLKEIDDLFPNERRVEVLSWLFEIFPFCSHNSLPEAHTILERCRASFENKMPILQEKSRCAFLRFIFESPFNLDFLGQEILEVYLEKREIDKSNRRIKIINRILIKYADQRNAIAFHILYGLLSSTQLQSYSQNGQNETSHELHNGCVHVCVKLDFDYLAKLASLLKSTSCDYGRLILNGLSMDVTKLHQLVDMLQVIKSLPETKICVKNKIAHVLPNRLKTGSSNEWPELLDYINI